MLPLPCPSWFAKGLPPTRREERLGGAWKKEKKKGAAGEDRGWVRKGQEEREGDAGGRAVLLGQRT